MMCREPEVRAATLVHTPGALALATVACPELTPTTVSCLADGDLLALLEPGELADSIRSGPTMAAASAAAYCCAPCGGAMEHGRLNLVGTLRPVALTDRQGAALRLCEVAPREELLDAMRDNKWLLAALQISAADWTLPTGTATLDPVKLCRAEVDDVLRWSPGLCARLNGAHPELGPRLVGRSTGWLAELDRDGATVGVPSTDGDPEYLRVSWPHPCSDLNQLHHLLVHCGPFRACRGE